MKTKQLFLAIAIASFVLAFNGCKQDTPTEIPPAENSNTRAMQASEAEKNKQVAVDLIDAFNARNYDKFTSFFADSYRYHPDSTVKGAQGGADYLKGFIAAFNPNLRLLHLVAEGDQVAYHIEVTGKHVGEFNGMKPTNNDIKVESIGIFRFENGKIAEEWENVQEGKMMEQLSAGVKK